jgi:acetyltransferase
LFKRDFLNPNSIAIIGASSHPEKVGFAIVKNILDGGFSGKIYPINPDAESIVGLKCFPSVLSVKSDIDLAVIAVPADVVATVLTECGKKRIRNAVVFTAGFSEIGARGKEREESIKKIAAIYGIRLLGPNCLGFIDTNHKLNVSFALNLPEKRNIAVISQSGATCTAILDWANNNGIGFSTFVSLGNKADLNENDFFEYLKTDPKTKVVLSYLESITDGERFLDTAGSLTKEKPLIILKTGRTACGKKAATSHTGALAGDDLITSIAFEEAGVIRAENLEDLFEWGQAFSCLEIKTNKIMVITNAGGPAVMATDAIGASKHLALYDFDSKETEALQQKIPQVNASNPLDLLGDATSMRFKEVFRTFSDSDVSKLILLTPQSMTDIDKIAEEITRNKDNRTVVVLIGGERFREAAKLLAKNRIPVFLYPERAVLALEKVAAYLEFKNKNDKKASYVKGFKKVADKVFSENESLDDTAMAKILSAYNIAMAESKITTNANEAIKVAERIGYPVVLKVTSPDILHKTEIGAIKLAIENEESLRSSYQEVLKNAKKHFPKAKILGVSVYKMVRSQVEVAIGAKRDPIFGPVIMFGLGGIYIELLKDIQLKLAPVSIQEAHEMIKGIKGYGMLSGYRNGEKFDVEAITKAISGLSRLMLDFPEIKEIDLNPIKVNGQGKGILALDAKMISEKAKVLVS